MSEKEKKTIVEEKVEGKEPKEKDALSLLKSSLLKSGWHFNKEQSIKSLFFVQVIKSLTEQPDLINDLEIYPERRSYRSSCMMNQETLNTIHDFFMKKDEKENKRRIEVFENEVQPHVHAGSFQTIVWESIQEPKAAYRGHIIKKRVECVGRIGVNRKNIQLLKEQTPKPANPDYKEWRTHDDNYPTYLTGNIHKPTQKNLRITFDQHHKNIKVTYTIDGKVITLKELVEKNILSRPSAPSEPLITTDINLNNLISVGKYSFEK